MRSDYLSVVVRNLCIDAIRRFPDYCERWDLLRLDLSRGGSAVLWLVWKRGVSNLAFGLVVMTFSGAGFFVRSVLFLLFFGGA